MKIAELLNEAQMHSGIKQEMVRQGYKFLGHGQDQDAYLAPDGTILKIFGYDEYSSKGQQSFIDFANYCMANPNNPFLPQFGGWEKFEFNGQQYLQIKCERLFDFNKAKLGSMANTLEELADNINEMGLTNGLAATMDDFVDDDYNSSMGTANDFGKLVTLVGGEENLKILAKTIYDLTRIADEQNYRFDLHRHNYMLGSDGEIVINDPFFTGSWRF
jgi:hypothetical protein